MKYLPDLSGGYRCQMFEQPRLALSLLGHAPSSISLHSVLVLVRRANKPRWAKVFNFEGQFLLQSVSAKFYDLVARNRTLCNQTT